MAIYDIIKVVKKEVKTTIFLTKKHPKILNKKGSNKMLKQVDKVNYRIVRALGILSEKDNITTELNLISYNNYKPKLDLRKWEKKGDTKLLQRGLTLTTEEARKLKEVLDNYLEHIDETPKEKVEN